MRRVSDYEALTRPLRADRRAADEHSGTNVFVPGLMGAGILLSAGILVSDGVKKLLPSRGTRRRIEVIRGVQSIVAGVAASAGVTVEEANISRRESRSRAFYILGAIILDGVAVGAVAKGIIEFNGDGILEGNAISIVFGSVLGAVAAGLAIVFWALGTVRRRRVPVATALMERTTLGRLQAPPETRLERARLLLPQFSEGVNQ